MADAILQLQPDVAPLTTLTARLNKSPTHNPDFQWAEDDLATRFVSTSTSYNSSATSVVLTAGHGQYVKANDLIKVPRTGEVMLVTAVSTDTLTVTRGLASSGAAMNSTEELLILGSAKKEGDTSDPAVSVNPSLVTNYTQIFRRPWHATETWVHSDQYVRENDWDYQARKAGIEHRKDIEEAFLFGKPSLDTSGALPRRTTGGVLHFISTNVTAAGGTLTEASFFTALRSAFRYGSQTKTLFAGGLVVDVLNTYPRSKVQVTNQRDGTYGVNVTTFQSPHGTVNLVRHWLLEGATYQGYGILLDMSQVGYKYLANAKGSRDTHINDNIQAPDEDSRKSEYLTEAGLKFGLEKTHALITGITG
jgi:hypothetical protein